MNQSRMRSCTFLVLSLFMAISLSGQIKVEGKVLSSNDQEDLIGVNILEKGTTNGTSTDINGMFELMVAEGAQLEVSYIGFFTKVITATPGSMTITMEEDVQSLDEVVVVGYGTQKKSDLVSAVATTDISRAVATPTADVNEMLRGRISGVQIDVGSGSLRPGGTSEINFRGRSSIEGNLSGIYVVDGVVRSGGIEDINPDDIESIEFLKDASAQAIYGSRAVNGVVLITTKRGNTGKVDINYHGYLSTQIIERNFDVYDGQEFAQLRREAVRSTDADDLYPADEEIFSETELESIAADRFVDWEDELLRNGMINNHNLSLSGGTEKTKVYASLNYFKNRGIIPTSSYERQNLRVNVDQEISSKVSTTFDLNFLNDKTERAGNINVITFSPLGRAYDDDGELVQFPSGEELTGTNPLWNLRESDRDERGNDFVVTMIPRWQISDKLQYQLKASITRRNTEEGQYLSSRHSSGDQDMGIARIQNQRREAYLLENILTYDNQINETDNLNITLVQAVDENSFSRTFTEGRGFSNESLGYNGITNAIGAVSTERQQTKLRTASFMGRARYNLKNKYMVSATFRADGASVNSADNKWTYNPAAAVAWKVHNEPFLVNSDAIEELKLRVSYGSLANALSRPYTSLFTADGQNYIFDGQSASGYSPSQALPNRNLAYETITTFNVGLDFSILKRFLRGSVEVYNSRTSDLLLRRGVPTTTGYTFTYFNAGEVENKGVELSLQANLINKEDFRWSVSANWATNQNTLLELYNDGDGNPVLEDDAYGYYVGQPVGVIRQYDFDGIYQVGDDFENSPQANPESTNTQENLRPGDIRVRDVNGVDEDGNVTGAPDGKITLEDRVFTDGAPDWFGSLSTNFSIKGFDLFMDFYAVQGATRVNPFLSAFNNGGTLQGKVNGVKVPYYTPENPSTEYPRPNFDSAPQYINSLAIQDASYVRLRTVRLGYTLPNTLTEKLNLEMINVYVTATNLFTITDYIGYSPEVNIRDTFSAADTGYPDSRVFTFGLRVGL